MSLHLLLAIAMALADVAAAAPADSPVGPNTWTAAPANDVGRRLGAVLVAVDGGRTMLSFGGEAEGKAAYVRAYDPAKQTWSDFTAARPPAKRGIHPCFQTACDPKDGRVYCLSDGVLYALDLAGKEWKDLGRPAALEHLSWPTLALDPGARRLVVVGSDKKADNLGWTRTEMLDLATGQWSRLPLPPEAVVAEHRQLLAAGEALIDLAGRTRLAWYRDPKGAGADAERKDLSDRCAAVRKMPGASVLADGLDEYASRLAEKKLLAALGVARGLCGKADELACRQYPVPPSRRNSPLVFDDKNRLFVLFGGDHEDYLLNDTWVLDVGRGLWRRAAPKLAPSGRAGHALLCLPGGGRIVLYEGYAQSNSDDYGARGWRPVEPRQLWSYDVGGERWDVLAAWQIKRDDKSAPPAAGEFYGYHAQHFSAPALAAGADGRLVLAIDADRRGGASAWVLRPDVSRSDPAARQKLGAAPDGRLYRQGRFLASYCDVADEPNVPPLESLPANRWVKLPAPPRNVAHGCRQRDWGTAVWDSANEQILLWGGGHCVRSASVVVHYSPLSGRMVEGYDADEPYSANGNGGYDSSLLNRPWVGVHSYNTYAYDPRARLMVSARGYLYDPARMDWLRAERMDRPFQYIWSATVAETTPHGVVVWGQAVGSERIGLWLHEGEGRWTDLKPAPEGALFKPYCDSEGMTYDSKRDRLILGWGGGYAKKGDGSLTTFDFKTRKVAKLAPEAMELGRIHNTREMACIDHADWVGFAEPYRPGEAKEGKAWLRIYDCAKDRYFLLDAGDPPPESVYSLGWCYDGRRKLLYAISVRGAIWAIRLDPAGAKLLAAPPAPPAADPRDELKDGPIPR